jgi:hypothetical protein
MSPTRSFSVIIILPQYLVYSKSLSTSPRVLDLVSRYYGNQDQDSFQSDLAFSPLSDQLDLQLQLDAKRFLD